MSARLETSAEVLKLARLLDVDPASLGYLEVVPADELRQLREGVTDVLFSTGAKALRQVGSAAKLLPSPLVASIAQRAFGPLLCARAAAAVDPGKAIDVAKRLPADFLADVTVALDPRRVAEIISNVPESLVVPVASELGRREEHVTMGRFLAYVPDVAVTAAMTALSDEALLRTAFVLEHKDRLDHALGLLPTERLAGIFRNASTLDLWSEALDLLDHLSDERRGPIADELAAQDPDVVGGLVGTVSEVGLWSTLLPLVRLMSEESRLRLAGMSPFHEERVLREIVVAAATDGIWVDLVPLLRALPADAMARIPEIVAGLDVALLEGLVADAMASADTLVPMLDIVSGMDDQGRWKVIEVIDGADRPLAEVLLAAATAPEQARLLAGALPADVMQAVERAADRVGLRPELDAALQQEHR